MTERLGVRTLDIVELNGKSVDFIELTDQDLLTFKHGDAVVIKYRRKGGKYSSFKVMVNLQVKEDQGAAGSFTSAGCSASPHRGNRSKRARPAEIPKRAKRV